MKTIFIVLALVAAALGVITFIVVFYPSGTSITVAPSNTTALQTSTVPAVVGSTTIPSAFSSTTSPAAPGELKSQYSFPYPLVWTEGQATLTITGASLAGNQLTFEVSVKTGQTAGCVPMNMRLVVDELGNLKIPDTPQFVLSDRGGCEGAPNTNYQGQIITFTIDPGIAAPFLFTTGGASNMFFQVATSTDGVLIALPSQSG